MKQVNEIYPSVITEKQAIKQVRHEVALALIKKYGDRLDFKIDKIDELCSIKHNVAPTLHDKVHYVMKKHNIQHVWECFEDDSKLDYLWAAEFDEVVRDGFFYFIANHGRKEFTGIKKHMPRDVLFYTIYNREDTLEGIDIVTKAMRMFASFIDEFNISPEEWKEMNDFVFNTFRRRISNVMKDADPNGVTAKTARLLDAITGKSSRE